MDGIARIRMDIPLEFKVEALEKAKTEVALAASLVDCATEAYEKNPTRENHISLLAARRLGKETKAMAEEWVA